MYKCYEVGTEYWTLIGDLSTEEKTALIQSMEADIAADQKAYPDEYFYWLIVAYGEAKDDAKSFDDYKEASGIIERLEWLRRKNFALEQRQKVNGILDQLTGKITADQANELRDTVEELTGLLSMYYK